METMKIQRAIGRSIRVGEGKHEIEFNLGVGVILD